MHIRLDDLQGPEIAALLQEHLRDMYATSPPESVHALDLDRLRQPDIQFWTVWDDNTLAGCGALKRHSANFGEIKSMRTAQGYRRCGVAAQLLSHIIAAAQQQGFTQLSLETGSQPFFAPACQLYEKYGFRYCGPFADYVEDPYSLFMTKLLG
jgi:putative acetyltransferase